MASPPPGQTICMDKGDERSRRALRLANSDRNATKKVETRTNLVTAMERVNGQLDAFRKPLPRPAKTVEQELGWATR
jgi:hypothetical protein